MKLKILFSGNNKRAAVCLLYVFFSSFALSAETRMVSIYDDFDDGAYGRSEYRSVFRTVKLSAFSRSATVSADKDVSREGKGLLTALVLSAETAGKLERGAYAEVSPASEEGIYRYSKGGLEFSFSLEKPGSPVLQLLKDYYRGEYISWLESVTRRYEENYIIRIHSAENIFDPWTERIDYNEALLMATLLGDREQWLWGIHDGLDILNSRE